jgi:hypothetical protein
MNNKQSKKRTKRLANEEREDEGEDTAHLQEHPKRK